MPSSRFQSFRKTRESGDGITYPYIDLPENESLSLDFHTAEHVGSESLENDYRIHHVYVDCAEIAEIGFPLEANPREPAETRQVKAMYETLAEKPTDFVKKNNGVVVISTDIDTEGSTVDIEFSPGEGICNGGHTYFAIMTADAVPESARLHLEVITIPPLSQGERKPVITDIAKARNNSNQLERRSEADFLGYYEPFQNRLEHPELVEWHENDSDANQDAHPITAIHFLRLLKSIDIQAYRHPIYKPDANSHKSLATSRSRFHNSWIDQVEKAEEGEDSERPFRYLYPLINDMMYIRDLLSYSFPSRNTNQVSLGEFRKTRLYQDYLMKMNDDGEPGQSFRPLLSGGFKPARGVELPRTMEVLFTGLFRSNIFWSSGTEIDADRYVGWIMDPEKLWRQRAPSVLEEMGHLFSDLDKDPKQFIRINAPFNLDLYEFGMTREVRPPVHLYDVESEERYKKVEKPELADFWMEKLDNDQSEIRLQPIHDEQPSSQAALYTIAEGTLQ